MKLFKAQYRTPTGLEFTVVSESEPDCADNDLRTVAAYAFKCHVGQLTKRTATKTNARILKNPSCVPVKSVKNAWII